MRPRPVDDSTFRVKRGSAVKPSPIRRILSCGISGVTALLFLTGARSASAATLEEIETCVAANIPEKSLRQSQTLSVADRKGSERSLEIDYEWKRFPEDRSKAVMRVTSPPDMRGTAVLLIQNKDRGNDAFSYLPEIGKTRRLNSRSLSSTVFGSDFSYEDIQYLQSLVDGSDQKLLADSRVNERPVYAVESRSQTGKDSSYDRIVTYIDAERCVLVRAEMYGSGDRLRKTMTASPAKVVARGKAWEATEIRADNLLQGTHSVLRIEESERDAPIKDAVFTPGALERRGR